MESGSAFVAIVDDDPAVLDSLKFLLEVAGHRVATYATAASFLDHDGRRPTCLIIDQHMPEMTGLELAARLRRDDALLPIMLITGSPSPAILAKAALLGIEKVLEKPPTEGELLRFIESHSGK